MKLSAIQVENIKPIADKDLLLADGNGLSLRIRPSGTKTWVIEYLLDGKRIKFTAGVYSKAGAPTGGGVESWLQHGRLSLGQARAIASEWKVARRAGHCPVTQWKAKLEAEAANLEAEKAAEDNAKTLQEAIDDFYKKVLSGLKSGLATRYRLERFAREIGGENKLKNISKADVLRALDQIAEGQKEGKTAKQLAGETLTMVKRLFKWAVERDYAPRSPVEEITRKVQGTAPKRREVTLQMHELVALWCAVGDRAVCKSDPVTVAALKLLILTGQRETEVTTMEWPELDLKAGLWMLPATKTKTKKPHLIHLSLPACHLLKEVKRLNGKCKHVFASPVKPKQPILGRSINHALQRLFKAGALPNVTRCTVHDLRRTLISRLPDLGFEPMVGHKIANHSLSGVMATYNHYSFEKERKAALLAWAEQIEMLASNVLQPHVGVSA